MCVCVSVCVCCVCVCVCVCVSVCVGVCVCAVYIVVNAPPHSPGYRYVHILSPSGEKLDQCTIFVHVKIANAADGMYEASPKLTEGGQAS